MQIVFYRQRWFRQVFLRMQPAFGLEASQELNLRLVG